MNGNGRKTGMENSIIVTILSGLTDYQESLKLQKTLVALRKQNKIQDILLLLEHPPILTLGKNADLAHILYSEETLANQGIKIYKSDRGGNVTYHGPGQIVGYPILNIRENNLKVKKYIWLLEQVFIDLLATEFSIKAYRDQNYRGVWVDNNKITAIGCAIKNWITMHGFAFNVNTNLDHFKVINPCGITDKGTTSLKTILGHSVELELVNNLIVKYFSICFDKQPQIIMYQDLQKLIGVEQIV